MSKAWTSQPLKTQPGREMRQMKCGNLTLTYQYFGHSESKMTILFLYGFGGNLEYLREIGPYLSDNDKYSFLSVDYPGHGFGEESGPFVVSEFVESVRILLESLNENKIILVGYSFGGAIAMQLYRQITDRVDKFILLNSDLNFSYNIFKYLFYKSYQAMLNMGISIAINRVAVPLLTDRYMRREIRLETKEVLLYNSLPHVKDLYRQTIFTDYENLAKDIKCPTLVVGSKCDFLISVKRSRHLHSIIPDSTLIIQSDIGHLCVITNPKATAEKILEWLNNS